MIQRIHKSKNLVAFVLAAATGVTLYFRMPSPEGNIFLRVTALQSPFAVEVLKYSRTLFLFSTPYIGYSVVFSGLYILALEAKQRIRAGKLPLIPDPWEKRRSFPRRRRGPQSPETGPRRVPEVAGHSREGFVHWCGYFLEDKADPNYYARCTVKKAQAECNRRPP